MTHTELIWQQLTEQAKKPDRRGFLRRRVISESPLDCFLALESPGNAPVLMLMVDKEDIVNLQIHSYQTDGIEIRLMSVPDISATKISLQVLLRSLDKSDIFFQFIDDVLNRLSSSSSEREGLDLLLGRVRKWQKFLKNQAQDFLSIEEQTGLYAELWFFRFLLSSCAEDFDVRAWVGPTGAHQDFHFQNLSIEVKATLQVGSSEIRISSERQLQQYEDVPLVLLWMSLERKRSQGETLVEIVESIKSKLLEGSARCSDFLSLLEMTGYVAHDSLYYSEFGYVVHDHQYFLVQDEFPRIVAADLAPLVEPVIKRQLPDLRSQLI